jgi:hypothetical protein
LYISTYIKREGYLSIRLRIRQKGVLQYMNKRRISSVPASGEKISMSGPVFDFKKEYLSTCF